MDLSFTQKIVLTIFLAFVAAAAIQGGRNFAGSVQKSMDADTIKARTPTPAPRRY